MILRNMRCAQPRAWAICCAAGFSLCLHSADVSSARAAIVFTGDVTPDPNTTTSSSTFYVGNTAAGSLTVNAGSTVTSGTSYIGNSLSVTGVATVTDAGSQWNASTLTVGNAGNGTLNISNGGAVTTSSVTSGGLGNPTVNISVSGVNSLLTTISLDLGESGTNSISVSNGGRVVSSSAELGSFGGSALATIDGAGSSFEIGGLLALTLGSITVKNGAALSTQYGVVGNGSTGTITVSGSQSIWNNSTDITLGSAVMGNGTLKILQGATVNTGGDTTIPSESGSAGQIVFDNGTLKTGGLIASVGDLQGTGTMFAHGLVTDINLTFDINHLLHQQFVFTNGASQNIAVNLDASAAGSMGAGFLGQGSLSIADGVAVNSKNGYLGFSAGSNGIAAVSGAGSEWIMTGDLLVGRGGAGSLTIQNGAAVQVGGTTTINTVAGSGINLSNGTFSTASLIAATSQLTGTGTINARGLVTDVALVFDHSHPLQQQITLAGQPNQNITVNLDVDGSGIMGAGYGAQGSLSIADGVTVSSTIGYLGYGLGSTGTATISGPGSKWAMIGALSIGQDGVGNLTISNGATVVDGNASVTNGKVLVTDPGSSWASPQAFTVGGLGSHSSEVLIANGGKLISAVGTLSPAIATIGGPFPNGLGKVTVDGLGSNWTHTGTLSIGSAGILVVSHGGAVTSTAGTIGSGFGFGSSTGAANVSGPASSWKMTGALVVGGGFSLIGTIIPGAAGALTIGPGGSVQAGDITIFSKGIINLQGGDLYANSINFNPSTSGTFTWTSGAVHVGTFNGTLVNSAGILSPGASPGTTTITGTYTQQAAATMQIELAGTTSGTQYDFVNITGTGNSTLGGTLQLSLLSGFLPAPIDTFTILTTAGNLLGSFTNVQSGGRLKTSDGLGSFLVSYGAGSTFSAKQVVLSNFQAVPEPSTKALLCLLLGAIAPTRTKRHP